MELVGTPALAGALATHRVTRDAAIEITPSVSMDDMSPDVEAEETAV